MSRRKDDEDYSSGAVAVNETGREIQLVGGVDDDTAGLVIAGIRGLDRKRGAIDVLLASSGGDEEAGWALYDVIRTASNEIRVAAFGACHSIAALVLQAGETRLLSPNCRMLIHNGSVALRGHYGVVQAGARESKFRTRRYYEALAERSEQSVRHIKALCDKETVLSAEEALTKGLADGIIVRPPRRGKKRSP